ncbi:MAG: extracellular solute-binding protein [Clostridia bacterium]|nr:extracellular solute-binding protein [Clostridia bacterium]
MNKSAIRAAALLLAALLTVPMAVSCGDSAGTAATDNTAAATDAAVETVDPNDRSQLKDNVPDTLDCSGRTFTTFVASPSGQGPFIAGPEESTGDIVDDAIIERNRTVEDRLGIKLAYEVRTDVDGSNIDTVVSKLLMAGDSTFDLFTGHQWGLTKLLTKGGIVPAEDLDYIELEQPWWWKEYMDELSLGGDTHYYFVGDFFLHALRSARVAIFNKELYADYYDNADELYQLVLDGKWTIDVMAELAKSVYVDLNNNGKTDADDQLGFCSWATYASTDPFVYGSDIEFVKRTADGGIEFTLISDDAVTLCQKLVDFFWQEGSYTGNTSDAEQYAMFSSGRVLFMGNSSVLSVEQIRDMECDFGILPCPKFDEEQKAYRTLVHDGGYLGAINGCSTNLDIAGAVLEVLNAETYRSVTPVYYETALKVKYTRDDTSAQMIDLIHDTLMTNFIYAYNYALNNIGLQYRTLITGKSKDYVSLVEKNLKGAETKLEALAEAFSN